MWTLSEARFRSLAQRRMASVSGTIRTIVNFRLSPIITTLEMNGLALTRFSISCGAMFLPPAVTMMSFFRSVMLRYPSVRLPMSPVWNHPSSSRTSLVLAGC